MGFMADSSTRPVIPQPHQQVFLDAARVFLALAERIEPEQFDRPGLGVWTVHELLGHTSRAITTVETYLTANVDSAPGAGSLPDAEVTVPDAETYYREVFATYTDHAAVARRGAEAAARLGDDPAAVIAADLARTELLLRQQHPTATITIGTMTLPLEQYLRTRTFELVVHGLDLARATGLNLEMPLPIVADTAALAARVAVSRGSGREVLFALTGRDSLPGGFSIF